MNFLCEITRGIVCDRFCSFLPIKDLREKNTYKFKNLQNSFFNSYFFIIKNINNGLLETSYHVQNNERWEEN